MREGARKAITDRAPLRVGEWSRAFVPSSTRSTRRSERPRANAYRDAVIDHTRIEIVGYWSQARMISVPPATTASSAATT
jgi:hypothetical protein